MATGIKQKLLAYHIAKRDSFAGQIGLTVEGRVPDRIKEQHDFHAEAVEFLSQQGG